MRRSFLSIVVASLAFACADVPSAPVLSADNASANRFLLDYPPPPFAIVNGVVSTEYGTFSFVGHFFANKPGNIAWLQFKSTSTAGVSFSANARIMSVNGDVSGVGTISIGSNTIQLSGIDTFNYQSYRSTRSISFSGGDVREGFASGPKGGGEVCYEACVIDSNGGR